MTQPSFDRTITAWSYQAPINHFILRLKFSHQLRFAKLLGNLFLDYLRIHRLMEPLPDCIIPVPLSRLRLRQRGFNQALEIARPVAQQLHIPLCSTVCERPKNTLPQTHLTAIQRFHNVKQAFVLTATPKYHHVVLMDDVMTTGATLNAISTLLKRQGVTTVEVWCCARAIETRL